MVCGQSEVGGVGGVALSLDALGGDLLLCFFVDFEVGEVITVIGGVWKDTVGPIASINDRKQSVTINVDMFGRETPVEISFADIKKM